MENEYAIVCYCKAGINYPLVPLYKWGKGLVYAFFAYKLQALHLSEKPCGKLAFRNGSSDRYWAQARDRDGAEAESRCAAGLEANARWICPEAQARDRDGAEAESRCEAGLEANAGWICPEAQARD